MRYLLCIALSLVPLAANAQIIRIEDQLPAVPKGGSYGCVIEEKQRFIETFDAKAKKVARTPQPSLYLLHLFAKDEQGKETWHFSPGPYDQEDEAFDDCKRWRIVVRHSLKLEEPKHATN
jgi:hypothetical protein